jgi:hypothetical protein
VSRYDWPRTARRSRAGRRRGLAAMRRQYNLDRSDDFDIETLIATPVRRTTGADVSLRTPPPSGDFAPAAAPPGPADPHPDRDLWLPVGPAGVINGGRPRVSGRVRDVIVSANGERAYAASALGGLWYTDTSGARWEPVGQWAMVPSGTSVPASSNTLTCGAVHVRFDPAGNDPRNDEVWVGTGEPGQNLISPTDFGNQGQYAGVGILHALGPVHTSRTDPRVDPWDRHAQPRPASGATPAYVGLRGAAVFRFAVDPADDTFLVAATTRGLHHIGPGPAADRWVQFSLAAWTGFVITDVAWTPSTAGHPSLLWVAVVDTTATSPAGTSVWVSSAGMSGPFLQVALPGAVVRGRLAFGADPAFPDVVYVLGSGPRLWRLNVIAPFPAAPAAPAVATAVTQLPSLLYGASDQSQYDMAIAIDPSNVNRIMIGGASAFRSADSVNGAALYRLTVSGTPPHTDYAIANTNAADPRWVGADVHADIHRLRWFAVGADSHVWLTCDGGVFRSTAAGDADSWVSQATGLAVLEPGFLANHPVTDGIVLIGCQDNGTMMRVGESAWRIAVNSSDGGGVAFDPGTTGQFACQIIHSDWQHDDDDAAGISPVRRKTAVSAATGEPAVFTAENNAASFYSNAAVVLNGAVTQLAVGTHRIWYSEQWGRTTWAGVPGVWRRQWTTLPSNTDPRASNNTSAANAARDVLPPGPAAGGGIGIRVLRWASPDRVYALTRGAIYQFDRNPPTTGAWTAMAAAAPQLPVQLGIRQAPAAPLGWPVAGPNPPDRGAYNDLAIHNAATGPRGSLYLATSHPREPLWWFDGQNPGQWFPARLGSTDPPAPPLPATVPVPAGGVRATAYAVVVDPDDNTIVYVGTSLGVWRGVFALVGGNPTWAWAPFNSALPEAVVQDLVITSWPRPAGGASVKLLRAALQSRGIFEVEPGIDVAPATYLRVHPYDTRRITPTDLRDPMRKTAHPERDWTFDWAERRNRDYRTNTGQPAPAPDGTPVGSHLWHASPDIRLYPAPGGGAVPVPPGLPWTSQPADRFWLWSVQTALRTIDPLIVPDGNWTRQWRGRLSALRAPARLNDSGPAGARITATLWNHAQVQAGFWTDPWAGGGPTEFDLTERIYGMATPRAGAVTAAATSPASLAVMRRQYRLYVCLHHRGREPLLGGFPAVVLFRLPLPANPATWAALPTVTTPPEAPDPVPLHQLWNALDLMGADGPLPAQFTVPAGWTTPDAGAAVRRPPDPTVPHTPVAATGAPAVVTFNVDFSADAAGSFFMFVALAHSSTDPVTLTGANLHDMILNSHYAAARSVVVI